MELRSFSLERYKGYAHRAEVEVKDFFDMKNGLPNRLSGVEEDLFADLRDGDRETLAVGFGPNVHECWSAWHVRDVGNELLARGRGDLEHGIELIRREL